MTAVQTDLLTRTVAIMRDHISSLEFIDFAGFPVHPSYGYVQYQDGMRKYAQEKGAKKAPDGDYILLVMNDEDITSSMVAARLTLTRETHIVVKEKIRATEESA